MNKYQRGKIYKIVSDLTDDVYIGSTTEPTLARRLAKHKGHYKSYLNGKSKYMTSLKLIETGNYDIVLLESYPCNSKDELHQKEREYIENTPNCVNKAIPTRTRNEYNKTYYDANKEIIAKKHEQYREENKDKIREYFKKNKTKLSRLNNEYRNKNKELLQAKKAKPFKCECGSVHRVNDRARHLRSIKHQKYITSITE